MWPTEHDPQNPDATPDLDSWGWDSYWSAADWLTWHRAMKARDGREAANARFLTFWQQQTFGASPLDARTFDPAFRAYAKENGFFEGLFPGGTGIIRPVGAIVTDVPAAVDDTLSLGAKLLPLVALAFAAAYLLPYFTRSLSTAK